MQAELLRQLTEASRAIDVARAAHPKGELWFDVDEYRAVIHAFHNPDDRDLLVVLSNAILNARSGSGEQLLRTDIEWCAREASAAIIARAALAALQSWTATASSSTDSGDASK